jgi:tRNA uridine 5-carbamoylmethylation protein Kti12
MIIIAGVPRSGKSILSKYLHQQLKYNYLPFDILVSTFGKLFPETGITHFEKAHIVSKKVAPLLFELIKHLDYEDEMMIIDLYQLFPKDLVKYGLDAKHKVVYLQ